MGRTQKLLSIFGLIALGACGRMQVSDTCECGFYTPQGSERLLHWGDGANVSFRLDAKMPDAFKLSMTQVVSSYNNVLSRTKVTLEQQRDANGVIIADKAAPALKGTNLSSVNGDRINGIYWITGEWPWAKENPDSDAMTLLLFDHKGITEADIFFKAESYGSPDMTPLEAQALFSTTGGYQISKADLPSKWVYTIGLHEMGHALGRVHSRKNNSLMFPTIGLGFVRTPFIKEDLEILSKAYSLKESALASLGISIPTNTPIESKDHSLIETFLGSRASALISGIFSKKSGTEPLHSCDPQIEVAGKKARHPTTSLAK